MLPIAAGTFYAAVTSVDDSRCSLRAAGHDLDTKKRRYVRGIDGLCIGSSDERRKDDCEFHDCLRVVDTDELECLRRFSTNLRRENS